MVGTIFLAVLAVASGASDPILALRQMRERCVTVRTEAGQLPLEGVTGERETYRLIFGDHYSYRWWIYTAELDPGGGALTVTELVGDQPGREARVGLTQSQANRIRRAAHDNGFWLGTSDIPPESAGFRAMMSTVLVEGSRAGETRCSADLAAIDLRAFAALDRELRDLGAVYDDLAEVEYETAPTERCLQPARIRGTPATRHYEVAQLLWVVNVRATAPIPPTAPRSSRRVETPHGPRIEDTWAIPEGDGISEVCFWRPADR